MEKIEIIEVTKTDLPLENTLVFGKMAIKNLILLTSMNNKKANKNNGMKTENGILFYALKMIKRTEYSTLGVKMANRTSTMKSKTDIVTGCKKPLCVTL
jgi:hypothetical protein